MRVLLVHNSYRHYGGEDAVFAAERDLLAGAGVAVETFHVDNKDLNGPAAMIKTAGRLIHSPAMERQVAGLIARTRPDVVHVHNFFPQITPSVFSATRRADIPSVMTLHNFRLTCAGAMLFRNGQVCEKCVAGSAYWGAFHRCYRGSWIGSLATAHMVATHRRRGTWNHNVDRFIALSRFCASKYIEAGLPPEKIVVKPNFLPDPGPPPPVPSAPNAPAVFVGRLSREKGILTLVEAWRHVGRPLLVAGDGPAMAAAQQLAGDEVRFLGQVDAARVRVLLREAAFIVIPSIWYEGLPMVLLEALAAGRPIIASRIGTLGEIVSDSQIGRLVEPRNAGELGRVLRETATATSGQLQGWGHEARKLYEREFTRDIAIVRLMEIYEALVNSRQHRSPRPIT